MLSYIYIFDISNIQIFTDAAIFISKIHSDSKRGKAWEGFRGTHLGVDLGVRNAFCWRCGEKW